VQPEKSDWQVWYWVPSQRVWPDWQVLLQDTQAPPWHWVPLWQKLLDHEVQPPLSETQVSWSPRKPHWVAPGVQVPAHEAHWPFWHWVPLPQVVVFQPKQPEACMPQTSWLPDASQSVAPLVQLFWQQVPTLPTMVVSWLRSSVWSCAEYACVVPPAAATALSTARLLPDVPAPKPTTKTLMPALLRLAAAADMALSSRQ
jgi:hypothetical protein